ncbi:hypothetical protein [Thalassovita aquimarina]|nr:hypothetical protein [Thalassovita aquimarina]
MRKNFLLESTVSIDAPQKGNRIKEKRPDQRQGTHRDPNEEAKL